MANKREFKKYVESIGASACDEMMNAYYSIDGIDKNTVTKAVEKVIAATAVARSNSNVFFDKGHKAFDNLKDYSKAKQEFFIKLFDKINSDLTSELDEALKLFNTAIPQGVKDKNKATVAE